jgi:hypothetical protein
MSCPIKHSKINKFYKFHVLINGRIYASDICGCRLINTIAKPPLNKHYTCITIQACNAIGN